MAAGMMRHAGTLPRGEQPSCTPSTTQTPRQLAWNNGSREAATMSLTLLPLSATQGGLSGIRV
eukprot:1142120-Pelagomonas_calceolata.AAC.1